MRWLRVAAIAFPFLVGEKRGSRQGASWPLVLVPAKEECGNDEQGQERLWQGRGQTSRGVWVMSLSVIDEVQRAAPLPRGERGGGKGKAGGLPRGIARLHGESEANGGSGGDGRPQPVRGALTAPGGEDPLDFRLH